MQVAAPGLLGCVLTAGEVSVRLTEVEAYDGQGLDPASHAHRGRTPRTAVMFGPPGYAYVYFSYGMHWCMNVVAGPDGEAAAVLLRAGSIVDGVELARSRRGDRVTGGRVADRDLARGPARLTSALGLDGAAGGTFLLDPDSPVRLSPPPAPPVEPVRSGPRVGVSVAADLPWRFWLDGDPTVTPYRRSRGAAARQLDGAEGYGAVG